MKSNRESKYKKTEIGMIPEDWKVVPFNKVLSVNIKHGIYKSKKFRDIKGTRILKMGVQYSNERIGNQEMERIRLSNDELKRFKIQDGDLIFSRTSMMEGGAGNVSIVVEHDDPIVFDGNLLCATLDKKIADPTFYYYYFKTKIAKHEILKITTGTQSRNIAASNLVKIYVPLPNYEEQVKISNHISLIDCKIQLNQKTNRILEAVGEAVFRRWFVDFEFPDEEGKPYKSSGGKMVDSEVGEIPKDWTISKLADRAQTSLGGTPKRSEPKYWNGKILWASAGTIANSPDLYVFETDERITEEGVNNSNAKVLPAGTIVITARGTVGEIRLLGVPCAINQTCYALTPKDEKNPYLLYYLLKTSLNQIESLSYGTVFKTITLKTFNELSVIHPSQKVIQSFNAQIEPLFQRIKTAIVENIKLSQIRDNLLSKLISGKIRVPVAEGNVEVC